MDEQLKKLVHDEVTKQMTSLSQCVSEVQQQNEGQSRLLAMQVARIDTVDRWTKKLWSNGSGGPPGYLEIARKEDKERLDRQERLADERFEKVFELIDELKADGYREEGKQELRKDLDAHSTHRLTRWHLWLQILYVLAGSWVLSLMRPVIHAFFLWLAQAIK